MLDAALSAELLAQTTLRTRSFARGFFRMFSWFGFAAGLLFGGGAAYTTHPHSLRDILSDSSAWIWFFEGTFFIWLFMGAGIGASMFPFVERDLWRVRRLLRSGSLHPATVTKHLVSGTRVHFVHLAWTVEGRPRTLHVALRDIDEVDLALKREMQVLDDGRRAALVMPGHGLFLAS